MTIYECNICGYKSTRKSNFEIHLNRKIPCNPNNRNKKAKTSIETFCDICKKDFSREDALLRHIKTLHNDINLKIGDNNHLVNNKIVNNNIKNQNIKNKNIKNQNIENIKNQNINIHITIPVPIKYDLDDINDLTLFEQYLSLTSKESPYTTLLDHLNLNPIKTKYHNIKYKDIHRNTIDVYNGKKWIKELVNNAVANVVDSKRILIRLILDRFRIFINDKAIKLTAEAYYYGSAKNFYFHKKVIQHMKLHLYNNRNNNEEPDTNIPKQINDHIWWALSKKFCWEDVERYINKMDKYEIDFSRNLDEIKDSILKLCEEKTHLKKFFKKVLMRISEFIDDFKNQKCERNNSSNDSSSTEDDFTGDDSCDDDSCDDNSCDEDSCDDEDFSGNYSCNDDNEDNSSDNKSDDKKIKKKYKY